MVSLTLKGVRKPHDYKKMTSSLLMIKMNGDFDERVRGPSGANILDCPRGVTAPSLKALVLVDDISGSHSGGWVKLVGPRRLLRKFGRSLGI